DPLTCRLSSMRSVAPTGQASNSSPNRGAEQSDGIRLRRRLTLRNRDQTMSIKPYDGDFDALTGGIFASWFVLGPNGPAAYALGFAEPAHRPWSLFSRGMRPTGAATYLGAAVDRELAATDDFFELFFNLLLGLNNHFLVFGGAEPLLAEIPAIVRTNGNPAVG